MIELCSSYWWWSRNAKQDVVWIGGFSREYDRSHFKAVEEVSEDSEDYQRRSIMYSIDFDIDNYWIGFYDKNAKAYAGRIRLVCTSNEDMSSYNFKEFFNYNEIEYEFDLQLQEKLLSRINWLIDEGIIEIRKKW